MNRELVNFLCFSAAGIGAIWLVMNGLKNIFRKEDGNNE